MYKEIKQCRICGNSNLVSVIHLGNQFLTGVFPKNKEEIVTCGPLELVKCFDSKGENTCGLLQLRQSYDLKEMYGKNYGYRSGLNKSMVEHLHQKVRNILQKISLNAGDIVLDIGSNDSTLLQAYPSDRDIEIIGMDPTGEKFKEYYPGHIRLVADFFSSSNFKKIFDKRKAKIITSISMFYDIEDPLGFMNQVTDILDDKGVWVFEQSYMPIMLQENAYDTICHEHLEYYGLKQIKWLTDRAGLKILDIEINKINGGSFSVMAAHKNHPLPESPKVGVILAQEENAQLHTLKPYLDFKDNIVRHRVELSEKLKQIREQGSKVFGYGASTKGNVILQWCGFTVNDIACIAEVNRDKFGSFTPGSFIPIIPEQEARAKKPDYFLVLPWHFRDNIIVREKEYLKSGGKLFFPLPKLEIVSQREA